jgi:subfamily B ATP-binding cassette protein HlyB/CyaB
VTEPRILILDEATSALDVESEQLIHRNMRAICKGRTVFVIAHRLAAVRDCDRILVLEKGRIAETGTPADLLAAGGRYAQFQAIQAGTTEGRPRDRGGEAGPKASAAEVA